MTRPTTPPSGRTALFALTGFLCITILGCAPEREPLEMETVELGAGPTDQLTSEGDIVESAAGSSGLSLPSDFPADLPVPPSASIVGSTRGRTTFGTEDSVDLARSQLERELRRAGWTAGENGGFTRNERSVRIAFEAQPERTLVVYRY